MQTIILNVATLGVFTNLWVPATIYAKPRLVASKFWWARGAFSCWTSVDFATVWLLFKDLSTQRLRNDQLVGRASWIALVLTDFIFISMGSCKKGQANFILPCCMFLRYAIFIAKWAKCKEVIWERSFIRAQSHVSSFLVACMVPNKPSMLVSPWLSDCRTYLWIVLEIHIISQVRRLTNHIVDAIPYWSSSHILFWHDHSHY